jgi:hypothetical protein
LFHNSFLKVLVGRLVGQLSYRWPLLLLVLSPNLLVAQNLLLLAL